ncbi:TetR/AcrR family transcriptional regulator [Streptomyces sp. NPDC006296]|uniref:TetR/AcrR family transcriptional regulator n=1 Tax=Streptomyces sp. NPDC006296 TaxID=3156746 RepID=UPI0033ADB600
MPEARAEEATATVRSGGRSAREQDGAPGGPERPDTDAGGTAAAGAATDGTPPAAAPADEASPAGAAPGGTTGRPRRRQARGEARVAQLLEAAAAVFCASGYNGASTNAIAREAGVSPGTLYQFFPNKEAIAIKLGEQLLHRWRETYGAAFVVSRIELPLDEMLNTVLDPLIAFNCENPAFAVLTHGSEIPGVITREHDALHASMLTRTEELLGAYLPELPADQVSRTAEMSFVLFKAGLDLVMAHEGAEREAYTEELKAVMRRYLEPLVCDTPDTEATRPPHTP